MSLVYSAGGAMPLPKLAWDFNGTTTDYVSGLTPTTTTGTITYGSGKYNQSIVFNGSSSIYYTSPVSITTTVGATISFWLYPTSVPYGAANQYYFSANNGIVSGFGIGLNANQTVPLVYFFSGQFASFSSSLVQNSWQHITVVISPGQTCSLYFNGLLSTSFSFSQDFTLSYIDVAQYYGGSSKGFCRLDDLRIFDRPLTSSQVQAIYNQQGVPGRGVLVPQSPQPSLMWQFESSNVDSVTGLAPSSSIGTLGYTPGKYGQAAFFNQTPGTTPTLSLTYTLPPGITANNCTISFWLKPYFNIPSSSGNQQFVSFVDSQVIYYMGFNSQASTTRAQIYYYNGSNNTLLGGSPTTQFWFHTVGVLSNVGQTGQNSNWTYYFNGVPGGSFVVNKTGTSPISSLYVGSAGGSGSSSYMAIDDLRVFNTALTAAQVQAIYATSGMPSRQVMTGTPLFNQLSQAARSSAVGAFSLRAVNGTSARAVQVRAQGQFPPAAMTSDGPQTLTGYSFGGSGSYVASASLDDVYIYQGFNAFDNNIGTWWHSNYPIYNSGTGIYNSGDARASITGGIYAGEWLQIKMTTPILLLSYSLVGRSTYETNRSPRKFWILGSNNDGANWSLVDTQTNINTWASPQVFKTFTISNPGTTYFNTFRIVVNEVGNLTTGASGQDSVQIATWNLVGSPPSQDFYADRLGNLLTAPVTGQSLANWLGGATGYVTTWYDQSGRGNDASQNTAANQPIIQRATKGPGYMVNFNGTSQFVTLSADSQFLNGTNITVNAVALRTATKTTQNWFFGTNTPSINYQRFQFGFQSDTIISMNVTSGPTDVTIPAYNASNEPVYYMTGGLIPSRVFYQNDTLGGTNTNVGLMSVPSGYSYSIGNGTQGGVYYYIGTLFELLLFTSALDQTQITQIYNNQFGAYGT